MKRTYIKPILKYAEIEPHSLIADSIPVTDGPAIEGEDDVKAQHGLGNSSGSAWDDEW